MSMITGNGVSGLKPNRDCVTAHKTIDLSRVREYDLTELFRYDLVSSPLLDNEGLMAKPQKATLMKELEKHISSSNHTLPQNWDDKPTAYAADVMRWFRKLSTKSMKTFGDLCESFVECMTKAS